MTVTTLICLFFFFNDTATTEIYTLSLHDALPIYLMRHDSVKRNRENEWTLFCLGFGFLNNVDRKSTRLNSSHQIISYAVFCLKKKKTAKSRTLDERIKDKKTLTTVARRVRTVISV